ncbi:MAG TPA: hypothetical protein PKK91_06385 [bacterium]|nr:hypothetical protein [bacterium]HQL64553.1 hypothetical protein [bacterium]
MNALPLRDTPISFLSPFYTIPYPQVPPFIKGDKGGFRREEEISPNPSLQKRGEIGNYKRGEEQEFTEEGEYDVRIENCKIRNTKRIYISCKPTKRRRM